MVDYLDTPFDLEDEKLASAYDEVPFWSFAFGKLLFDNIALSSGIKALDLGYGTGFPMLELASRLGRSATVYGLDRWGTAKQRAQFKARIFGIENLVLVDGDAHSMPFENEFFDLIVCNVGINNFDDPQKVFAECFRIAHKGAQLAFTTNPRGHMEEFYQLFARTLDELDLKNCHDRLNEHQNHRLSQSAINEMLQQAGFVTRANLRESFVWRFVDGTAFLNHHMIKRGFVGGWKEVIPAEQQHRFFTQLEHNLNQHATQAGEFSVTIPMAYIEVAKP